VTGAVVIGHIECHGARDAEQGQLAFDPCGLACSEQDAMCAIGNLGMCGGVEHRRAAHELRRRLTACLEGACVDDDVELAALLGRIERHGAGGAVEFTALGGAEAAHFEGNQRARRVEREFGRVGAGVPADGGNSKEAGEPAVSGAHEGEDAPRQAGTLSTS
jgi:hypothetical protein